MLIKARLMASSDAERAVLEESLNRARNKSDYSDVSLKSGYAKYLLTARELGVFRGYKKGNKLVSRGTRLLQRHEAAKMIVKSFFANEL